MWSGQTIALTTPSSEECEDVMHLVKEMKVKCIII